MSSMRALGDEFHREDTSKRNHEKAAHAHAQGHVVGGRVFGYTGMMSKPSLELSRSSSYRETLKTEGSVSDRR